MTMTDVSTDTPRIYVASLSDYNNGVLHGVWVDATDIDDIDEAVKAMLASSPTFKDFPEGGPAEEYAIHDYEGFGAYRVSEHAWLARVAEIGAAIEEHGPAVAAYLAASIGDLDGFEEAFVGHHDSAEEYGAELFEDLVLSQFKHELTPDLLRMFEESIENHIDPKEAGEDLLHDYSIVDADGGGVYIFNLR